MKNIAVFASGNGSNFQSLKEAELDGRLKGNIKLLISDKPDANVVKRAELLNVPVFSFEAKNYQSKSEYEQVLVEILQGYEIDLIILAGYMRIVGITLLSSYKNKIINLHPSLLPAFPGKDAIGQAFSYGVKITGATVHFVDEGMDTGPIIKQQHLIVDEADSIASLTVKIHDIEHALLTSAVNLLVNEQVRVEGRRVTITDKVNEVK